MGIKRDPVLSITSSGEIGFWEHDIEASKMQGRPRGRTGERKTYHITIYHHITMEFGGYLLNVAKNPTRAGARKGEAQGVLSYQKATGIFDNPLIHPCQKCLITCSWNQSEKKKQQQLFLFSTHAVTKGTYFQLYASLAWFPHPSDLWTEDLPGWHLCLFLLSRVQGADMSIPTCSSDETFVPNNVTLSQEIRWAWPVSIPASCFFAQQALHEARYSWASELRFLKAVGRTRIEGSCKVYVEKTWKTNWKLYRCSLASKKWGAIEALLQMSLIWETCLLLAKHVTLSLKMLLALLVSIPLALSTSSEVLPCAHEAGMSLDMSEKCQLDPVRIPRLFQQNGSKAVRRTQIEGSCKVYAGKTWKTNWKLYRCSLASKKWGAIEALLQMTLIRAAFTCSKACDIVAEDAFSVASQHSIGRIDIKRGTFMRPPSRYVTWYVGEMPTCSSENS